MQPEPALDEGGPSDVTFEPWPQSVLQQGVFTRFQSMVARNPQRLAISAADGQWTYSAIEVLALRLAAHLAATDTPVAVFLAPGGALVAALLACLATGRPYVPLDPAFPAARNRLLLQHCGAGLMISSALLAAARPELQGVPCLELEQLATRPLSALHGGPDSPAYILYTSGSTGVPKGVFQNQRGLLQDVYEFTHSVHLHAEDELSGLYSPSVAGAIRDIYGALLNGAGLHFLDVRALGLDGVAQATQEQRLTIFHMIPPLLRAFLRSGPADAQLQSVRLAYLAGDRLFRSDVEAFYRHFPQQALLYVGIGSTENATLFRQWFIRADTLLDGPCVATGHAIPGRELRVLGADGREVACGEIGELESASRWLAQGYWGDEALTRRAFVDDGRPGWRRFRSGDLGVIRADGLLEFVGRGDAQVKIRGYRVELSLVEAELRMLPGVTDAAVLVRGSAEYPQLTAWVVGDLAAGRVRQLLSERLPDHHVPTVVHGVTAIPALPNFKHDLQALQQAAEPVLPALEAEVQGKVAACWCQALRLTSAPEPELGFADAGGDSMAALSLRALLQQAIGRTLPLGLLHADSSIRSVSLALQQAKSSLTTLFVVGGPLAWFEGLQEAVQHLGADIDLQLVALPMPEPSLEAALDLAALGEHVAACIRRSTPAAPVHLLGLSFGGRVVVEAARCLAATGQPIGEILLGDVAAARSRPALLQRWRQRWSGAADGPGLGERLQRYLRHRTIWLLPLPCQRAVLALARRCIRADRLAHWEARNLFERRVVQSRHWRPPRLATRLTVLHAEDGPMPRHDDLGWAPYAASVRVIHLPGKHLEFLREPHVHIFAQLLPSLLLPDNGPDAAAADGTGHDR